MRTGTTAHGTATLSTSCPSGRVYRTTSTDMPTYGPTQKIRRTSLKVQYVCVYAFYLYCFLFSNFFIDWLLIDLRLFVPAHFFKGLVGLLLNLLFTIMICLLDCLLKFKFVCLFFCMYAYMCVCRFVYQYQYIICHSHCLCVCSITWFW